MAVGAGCIALKLAVDVEFNWLGSTTRFLLIGWKKHFATHS